MVNVKTKDDRIKRLKIKTFNDHLLKSKHKNNFIPVFI